VSGAIVARYLNPAGDASVRAPTVDAKERLYTSSSTGLLCLERRGAELVKVWSFDVAGAAVASRPSIDRDGTLYYALDTSEIIAVGP
jgi:outer membrane protein assembly factor BamB